MITERVGHFTPSEYREFVFDGHLVHKNVPSSRCPSRHPIPSIVVAHVAFVHGEPVAPPRW